MKSLAKITSVMAIFVSGYAAAATDGQPILSFADQSDTGGESFLTRDGDTVLVTVEAQGLTPGNAVTLWWVVFNNPDGCSGGVCGDDEFNPGNEGLLGSAQVAVGNASGNVVKSNGTLEFGGVLRRNTMDDHQVLFGAGFSSPYLLTVDPNDAEIHLVVQVHGQARGGKKLREQLTYFEANCTPTCSDVQFSMHLAPGS